MNYIKHVNGNFCKECIDKFEELNIIECPFCKDEFKYHSFKLVNNSKKIVFLHLLTFKTLTYL